MVSEHSFDLWQRFVGSQARRRGFLRTAVALIVTFPISVASKQRVTRGKKKGKRKHQHKGHGKPGSQSPRRYGRSARSSGLLISSIATNAS